MSFVLFFRGMVATLIVFAVATFALTQSVWTTFISTVICAVIIQVGYFLAVLFMVWRDRPDELPAADRAELDARTFPVGTPDPKKAASQPQALRNIPRSGQ
jgi:exopolysaccharide production repressor protein